jgi:hypothetical protein
MSENTPPEIPVENNPADQDEIAQWLAEAEIAAKAEDWDKTISLYRQAQNVDRIREGVEAKLQWALRMRDIHKLYKDGQSKLAAGEYEAALIPLRKARVMYASHYKDTDDLILQAQTALQQQKWEDRPDEVKTANRGRSPLFFIGVIAIVLVGTLMLAFLYLQGNSPNNPALPQLSPNIPVVSGPVTTTSSGLLIIEVKPGTGTEAKQGSMVSVHYTGYLTDGTKFDSSIGGDPIVFPLGTGSVIEGWDEGLLGMKVGEKRRLIIPPSLGYGAQGAGGVIPPNATLVFDVELTQVQ